MVLFSSLLFIVVDLSNHYLVLHSSCKRPEVFCPCTLVAGNLLWHVCSGGWNRAGPWWVYHCRRLSPASVKTMHWRAQGQWQGDQSWVQRSRREMMRILK